MFGVGSQVPGGVADLLQGRGGAIDAPSIDDSRERIEKNPQDAEAHRDLAEAYTARGNPEAAIAPLEAYMRLRPRDEQALRELATLYLTRASRIRNDARIAQMQAAEADPGQEFAPPASTPLGQALGQAPISDAVASLHQERLTTAFTETSEAYTKAKEAYVRLARLVPDDPDVQLQLADASLNAGDAQTAIRAYERFLKIDPDNASAPLVREQLKGLKEQAKAQAAAQAGG